jgi:hypothetical protein
MSAYRPISKDDYLERERSGATNIGWAEGVGYYVEDRQALEEFWKASDQIKQQAKASSVTPAPPQAAWQPIETAPRSGTRVLLFQRPRGAFEGWWKSDFAGSEAYWTDDQDSEPAPTHWQPLLPPPASALSRPEQEG